MKKKKVILTGGLGFIGSNLVELLIKKNFYVINIDKISYSSNFYNVKDFKIRLNFLIWLLQIECGQHRYFYCFKGALIVS